MDDLKPHFLVASLIAFGVGLWMLIGDGTCITACQSTAESAVLWGGVAALAVSVVLTRGAGLILAIPATGILFVAKATALGRGNPLFGEMLTWGLTLLGLGVAMLLLGRWGIRNMERRETALKGRALVLEVKRTGTVTESSAKVRLHLLVEPSDGGETFEVTQKCYVAFASPVRSGDELPVWIDPDDRQQVDIALPGDHDYPPLHELEDFGIDRPRLDDAR